MDRDTDTTRNPAIDPEDPRLSAYVLGELEGAELESFERELEGSEDLRRLVDDFRDVAGRLKTELATEPCPALSESHRAAIEERATSSPAVSGGADSSAGGRGRWRGRFVVVVTALAACALVAVTLWPDLFRGDADRTGEDVQLARRAEPAPELAKPVAPAAGGTAAGLRDETLGEAPEAGVRLREQDAAAIKDSFSALSVAPRGEERAAGRTSLYSATTNGKKPGEQSSGVELSIRGDLRKTKTPAPTDVSANAARGRTVVTRPTSAAASSDGATPDAPAEAEGESLRQLKEITRLAEAETRARARFGRTTESLESLAGEPERKRVARRNVTTGVVDRLTLGTEARDKTLQPGSPDALGETETDATRILPRQDREEYEAFPDNPFVLVAEDPRSTFSIDVDTASYANIRRMLRDGRLPGRDAVRIEEMINYFTYAYPEPTGEHPFSVNVEVAECPWNGKHRLARVGLRAKSLDRRPPGNFVFLIDASGSMRPENKLPLLKHSMRRLVRNLTSDDRVGIVVYAGSAGVMLPSTRVDLAGRDEIEFALDKIVAGSGTHASAGIQLAYDIATRNFIEGGTNRVILATDGDFNVGITDTGELVEFIKEKARTGVFLSVLGFGTGNLKDEKMENLADNGNGNYNYIDSPQEGHKVLVEELSGTLVTVAKDVKVQVEFNPATVAAHRLIGYENRKLEHIEFNDDTRDAGEIGAGHTVTALYEVIPVGAFEEIAAEVKRDVDPLRYQEKGAAKRELTDAARSGELFHVKLRYKEPDGEISKLIETPVVDEGLNYGRASDDFKFAASVAAFGMILRNSEHRGSATLNGILELAAEGATTGDEKERRAEFLKLVERARELTGLR